MGSTTIPKMTLRHLQVLKVVVDTKDNTHLHSLIWEMLRIADEFNCSVESNFNGVPIVANPGDRPILLQNRWHREYNKQ